MIEPGRKYSAGSGYRYGFNGQEKSTEIGEGFTTAEFWEYDSRVGRRWNIDPIVKVSESPYMCFSGNPILFADPNGDDPISGNSKGDRSMRKYERKLDRMRRKNPGMSEEDLDKQMTARYGMKDWMRVGSKNESKNGNGFEYYDAGKLYRHFESLRNFQLSPTQEVGMTIVDNGSVTNSQPGTASLGFYWVLSVPNADKLTGKIQVQFTIDNAMSDGLTTQIFNGINTVIGFNAATVSQSFIDQQDVGAYTKKSSGYFSLSMDKSNGQMTVQAFYACLLTTVKNNDGTYSNAPNCNTPSGGLGVIPPISATAIVPRPVLKPPRPEVARQSATSLGRTNRHPERLNRMTKKDLLWQSMWSESVNLIPR